MPNVDIRPLSLASTLLWTTFICLSQEHIGIQGQVLDEDSREPLPYATIGIKGKPIGTISNTLGEFNFNFSREHINDTLFISMLGYRDYEAVIKNIKPRRGVILELVVEPIVLDELSIAATLTGNEIIEKAVKNIRKNHSLKPFVMEGFFRQIQKVDSSYTSLLEAAANILDPGYLSATKEKVDILEIRRSHYLDIKNYLNVADTFYTQKHNSLEGTLMFNTVRDIASSKALNKGFYKGKYTYRPDSVLYHDGRNVYVISAAQKLNKGYLKDREKENRANTILVDAETFAVKKVIFQYSPKDNYDPRDFRNVTKTNDSILSVVTGHTHIYEFSNYDGLQYLKYIRWSDWVQDYNLKLQKISHTNEYRHELLINRIITDPAYFPEIKETMDPAISLHLQVKDHNAAFWENYNIIYESPSEKQLIDELMKEISTERSKESQNK